ncbi:efflux RND transporter periplasmic adaptor subunit [Neptunicella sp. SCSIO 80796]|uniref:efflux RND transporter periplasmic adaptor subunit n=1 Tax=Neptunicella plasticusilytica TaxID=3117012 RepID=UPI003A4D95D6
MQSNICSHLLLVTVLSFSVFAYGQQQINPITESSHSENEGASPVILTDEQIAHAGIQVETLQLQPMQQFLYAPAEIKANGYSTYIVSPRVDSVVLTRHVSLGEHVVNGQPLVTLFSDVIAQAQARYRIDYAEWNRIRKLAKTAVSEKNISEAQTGYIASLANLKAFGLTDNDIKQLTADNSSALGEYTLQATQSGSVLNDDFQQGQRVEAGQALMILADESELWVEARLSPDAGIHLPTGSYARLEVGKRTFSSQVIQQAHTIDPLTRTRVVRLSVQNNDHQLHAGMFADVFFDISTDKPVLAVPEAALVRGSDGDWMVFVQVRLGEYASREVTPGHSNGVVRQITGIAAGTAVVVQGAFFVASEQAKSGFDPHNH